MGNICHNVFHLQCTIDWLHFNLLVTILWNGFKQQSLESRLPVQCSQLLGASGSFLCVPGSRAFNSLFPSTCRSFAPGSHRLPLPREGPLPLHVQECSSLARMRGSATPHPRRSSRPGARPWVTQDARAQSPFEGFPSNPSAIPTIHSCFLRLITPEKSLPSGTPRTKQLSPTAAIVTGRPPSPGARPASLSSARAASRVVSPAAPAPSAARARARPALGAPRLAAAGTAAAAASRAVVVSTLPD